MDPVEALEHICILLQAASDSGDLHVMEKKLAEAQEIVRKALPPKKSEAQD